jgi:surfeit locus 1 family protein
MRLPFLPTLFVAVAVAVMVGLGIWQLQRGEWKQGLLAEMRAAETRPPYDVDRTKRMPDTLLTRAAMTCTTSGGVTMRGGQNRSGEGGYRYLINCTGNRAGPLQLDLGWSKQPNLKLKLAGIEQRFTGILYERGDGEYVLTSDKSVAPLQPSRPPSADDTPNNHLFYAIQWFFFAAAAAIIYLLALQRRRHL